MDNSKRWTKAVDAEARAYAAAQHGDQLARIEAFRTLVELSEAKAGCDEQKAAIEKAKKAKKKPAK